ncbi:hypothetical protein EFW17_18120 [Halostreptopolyspora alba]|uniref:Septum formation-related domain-containing protein n=1 Tax=Halostreptopolyspora alba TaxID=2487137 RepID=A0A3N0E4W5_9ACTN|nr:hypothetical protein EFW17_18120 [Nocardiopsaceae bacterium YIM 96095]
MLSDSLRPCLRPAATGVVALSAVMVLSSCGIAQRLAEVAAEGSPPPSGSERTNDDEGGDTGGGDTGSGDTGGGGTTGEEPASGDTRDIFDLRVGDCVNDESATTAEGGVTEMPVVDCSEPHDSEVIAIEELESGRPYPGDDVVSSEAEELCTGRVFEDYIGVPWIDSIYNTGHFTPVEEGWEAGDYEVICIAYEAGTKLTGSVEGSME